MNKPLVVGFHVVLKYFKFHIGRTLAGGHGIEGLGLARTKVPSLLIL